MLTDDVLVLYRGEAEFDEFGQMPTAVVLALLDHIDAQAECIADLEALEAAALALIGRRVPVASDVADMVLVGRDAYFALVAALEPVGTSVIDPDRSPQNREAAGW